VPGSRHQHAQFPAARIVSTTYLIAAPNLPRQRTIHRKLEFLTDRSVPVAICGPLAVSSELDLNAPVTDVLDLRFNCIALGRGFRLQIHLRIVRGTVSVARGFERGGFVVVHARQCVLRELFEDAVRNLREHGAAAVEVFADEIIIQLFRRGAGVFLFRGSLDALDAIQKRRLGFLLRFSGNADIAGEIRRPADMSVAVGNVNFQCGNKRAINLVFDEFGRISESRRKMSLCCFGL
jgi:hypothetical protein